MIKKLLGALALSFTCALSFAAEGGHTLDRAPDRINDLPALQNGAKLFVNYCLNCHSAKSMRYNKLTEIGLTEEEIKKNLLFTSDRIGDLMTIAMSPQDGKSWFGAPPPDLSVIARAKSATLGPTGVDYIYSYLRAFYRDTSKATGWNNLVFPDVGMPNVLWELQGPRTLNRTTMQQVAQPDGSLAWQRSIAKYDSEGFSEIKSETIKNYHGGAVDKGVLESPDLSRTAVFDNNVADLSNFMGWMAEPGQQFRKQLGVWVLLFLAIFLLISIRLNAAYWKHVK